MKEEYGSIMKNETKEVIEFPKNNVLIFQISYSCLSLILIVV